MRIDSDGDRYANDPVLLTCHVQRRGHGRCWVQMTPERRLELRRKRAENEGRR